MNPRRDKEKEQKFTSGARPRAAQVCNKRTNIPQVARKFIREGVGKRVNSIHRRCRQPRMSCRAVREEGGGAGPRQSQLTLEAVHVHAHPVGQAILAVHEVDFHALAVGREAIVAEADDHVAVHLLEEVVPERRGKVRGNRREVNNDETKALESSVRATGDTRAGGRDRGRRDASTFPPFD